MAESILLAELSHTGVLQVTLNRPGALNALSTDLLAELTRTWARAALSDVRAIVITGAGKGFCAGADLRQERTGDVAREGLRTSFHPHILALAALEKPVIAAVNGAAAGAGLALVFAADIRIASPTARLVPSFGRIGLVPDSGVGYLAARVMGEAAALAWLGRGLTLNAEDALSRGVYEQVANDPVAVANELAAELAAVPGSAYGLTKRMLWAEGKIKLAANLDLEVELQQRALADPARAEARAQMVAGLGSKGSKMRNEPDPAKEDGDAE